MNHTLSIVPESAAMAIAVLAEQRLHNSPYFFLKGLRCRFQAGVLTVSGRVPYGQLRVLAEAIVSRVQGVERVANEVQVVDPATMPIDVPAVRNAG